VVQLLLERGASVDAEDRVRATRAARSDEGGGASGLRLPPPLPGFWPKPDAD